MRENPVPLPPCTPQIPDELAWYRALERLKILSSKMSLNRPSMQVKKQIKWVIQDTPNILKTEKYRTYQYTHTMSF
jgi:hypothetical protein